jgi:hypothetical protein
MHSFVQYILLSDRSFVVVLFNLQLKTPHRIENNLLRNVTQGLGLLLFGKTQETENGYEIWNMGC